MNFKEYYEDQTLEEGIAGFAKWLIPLVLSTAVVASDDTTLTDKIKDSNTSQAVDKLMKTTPKEWDKLVRMASMVKRFTKIDDNLAGVLDAIGDDAGEIVKYVADQKFDIEVKEDLETLMDVDTENKKIYVKDVKIMEALKGLVDKGMLKVKEAGEKKEPVEEEPPTPEELRMRI